MLGAVPVTHASVSPLRDVFRAVAIAPLAGSLAPHSFRPEEIEMEVTKSGLI
jgi:hypothetical protein